MLRLPIAVILVSVLLACNESTGSVPSSRTPNAGVEIFDNSFSPDEVSIARGEHVTWLWRGQVEHSIRFFGSPTIARTDTTNGIYDREFAEPGVYDYFCTYHGSQDALGVSGMSGRVVVN